MGHLLVEVDAKAGPFRERLVVEVSVDQDLILTVSAWSLNQKGRAEAKFFDLDFALAFPGSGNSGYRLIPSKLHRPNPRLVTAEA